MDKVIETVLLSVEQAQSRVDHAIWTAPYVTVLGSGDMYLKWRLKHISIIVSVIHRKVTIRCWQHEKNVGLLEVCLYVAVHLK